MSESTGHVHPVPIESATGTIDVEGKWPRCKLTGIHGSEDMDVCRVYFDDGSSCVIEGRHILAMHESSIEKYVTQAEKSA